MLIRSLSVLGAAAAVLTVYSADAGAFGLHHRGGKYMTCYKKAVTPPVYKTVAQRVMLHPGTVKQACQPAVYQTVTRQVMVSPGSAQWVSVAYTGHPVIYHQPAAANRGYQYRAPQARK